MKPLYCGNIEYEARQSEIERLFGKYGRVERVDMKSGYAFIYMEDEQDAEDAIRGLDDSKFGRQRRRLSVEWKKPADRGFRRSEDGRRSVTGLKPTKTLFVINFDSYNTKARDLERHFEPYGKVLNVRIRRNFAFVQYESQDEATKALDSTNMSKILDRVIRVAYAQREDGDRRDGHLSPIRRGRYGRASEDHDRDRSESPIHDRRAVRGSPDYGRAPSPIYARRRERRSPDYGRAPSPYARHPERRSSDHGRSASPVYASRPKKNSPDNGRVASPVHERDHRRQERRSSDHGRSASPVYVRRPKRNSPDNGRVSSPVHEQDRSRSPVRHSRHSTDHGRSASPVYARRPKRNSPDNGRVSSPVHERDRSRSPVRHSRRQTGPSIITQNNS